MKKKLTKKILGLFLAGTMAFSLAACGGGDTPAPVYTDPPEETRDAKDLGEVTVLFTGNVQNIFEKNETRGEIGYAAVAAYRDALEEYQHCFDVVEFAIYARGSETENYRAFEEKLLMYTEK